MNSIVDFPTLYKKTETGAIQFWEILVQMQSGLLNNTENSPEVEFPQIVTTYGQVGTDSPQKTFDVIYEGKNKGKKNETNAFQQASKEAEAKWKKQLKKGYVESIEKAEQEEIHEIIEGGIEPMLAFTYEKQGHKIKYPCFGSKKLDGLRMIAIIKNGKASLWSRTRKPITSMNHLIKELEEVFPNQDLILDGEAFNNDYKNDFESIVSKVRKDNAEEGAETIQYHVFDIVNDKPFTERYQQLTEMFEKNQFKHLVLVENEIIQSEDEVAEFFQKCKKDGQEGCMLRNAAGLYVNKRSADLIKVKEMQDEEFRIIGIEEGRGKLQGHVGSFICLTNEGQEFNVKMAGNTEKLKEYFENKDLWYNKLLTVQFQDYTQYQIPRFPVGLRIREDI